MTGMDTKTRVGLRLSLGVIVSMAGDWLCFGKKVGNAIQLQGWAPLTSLGHWTPTGATRRLFSMPCSVSREADVTF